MSESSLRIAVIPCAGLGSRMLPWSRAVPKELLPVGDLPVLHYVLAEAVRAGIETIVLVNAVWKRALERYLEPDRALEAELEARGRLALLEPVRELARRIELVTTFQHEPLGLGHAVRCAAPVVDDAPFAVLLPDELVLQQPPLLSGLTRNIADGVGGIGVIEVPETDVHRYGIVQLAKDTNRIVDMIEKPSAEAAPSRLAIIGRYAFPSGFMRALEALRPGAGGELQLTDAMRDHLNEFPLQAVTASGLRFDTGNPDAYAATWRAWLDDPEPFRRAVTSA